MMENASAEAQQWNYTSHKLDDLPMDRHFLWLLVSLISAILWLVYITYYNSRLVGYCLTRLINRFYFQDEHFKIGSFTVSALAGKIMFRDIVYVNYDYSLRIQDGYLIFRWWRAYVPKDVSEDLSHSDTRLSIMLNGVELHVYNRCDLYSDLEKVFGIDSAIKLQQDDNENEDREKAVNEANERKLRMKGTVRSEAALARTWRDLIPVIKIDICTGRVVFGNRLVPTTLSLNVEEAHLVYSTKPPASSLDYLMHFVKAKAENCKVMLAPSPNYTGMVDDPPRYMGEGFVVMSSNYIELYFYMDQPGLVPEHPVLLQLANGDIVESAPPIWGIDIKCGKGTDFSYGPWADRQREHLFRLFYPADYKNLEVTPQPKPGDVRQMQSFDIRLSTLNEATIDILFSKNKETNAVHINIGAGSYLEVTLPWIVLQDGYTTKITGQLLHLEATTSLQYRSLAESETLEFSVRCHYPLVWNHHQCWQLGFTGCKATANLVYSHKYFIQDLLDDWSSKARPDILHFVPYTWKISLLLKEFEIVTLSNQYNWIDCSSTNQENNHVAFCGDLFDLSFDLPFVDFLPETIPVNIWIQGEALDMSMYLPEVSPSRLLLLSIDKNMKLMPGRHKPFSSKWRRRCISSQGWVDCWSVPIVALSIKYTYHPIPPLGPDPQADITTPEKEEILLSPMRISRVRKQPQIHWSRDGFNKFDPTVLTPDKISVELEIGPSVMLVYGSIVTNFVNLKENIFGEDQTFTDMHKPSNFDSAYWSTEQAVKLNDKHNTVSSEDNSDASKAVFDPRLYRPFEVTVSLIMHDIQAHIVKNCSESEPPCPVVIIERLGFEMDKRYKETKLQVLVSPAILISANNMSMNHATSGGPLNQGHLMLSSLQLRGHALFSDRNRSVEEETIEYAWMLELQLGQLTGRMTLPQMYHVITSLETFVLLVLDDENALLPPNPAKICHHGEHVAMCAETNSSLKYRCPTVEDIKYRMTRIGIDLIDIFIADANTTFETWISPVRMSICNLHGSGFGNGMTALLPNVKMALYTQTNPTNHAHHQSTGSGNSYLKQESDQWVVVGSLSFGPLLLEAATSLPQSPKNIHMVQQKFLRIHDERTKRLWFLWPSDNLNAKGAHCGCTGGCVFFGSNRNGATFLKPCTSDLQDGINIAAFNIFEQEGEYGYGQSLLHEGQLVFHTSPYNGLNICLQPTSKAGFIPSPLPQSVSKSPQPSDRKSLTRRFSYTSVSKSGNNTMTSSNKSDVPYARLVDTVVSLGNSKIDSDSKLNKVVLSVPQMESSVSDSKLAMTCVAKDSMSHKKYVRTDSECMPPPKVPKRKVSVSDSHYSLNSQAEVFNHDAQRTLSINSENHSDAFFSADEDLPSRSSSLKHSVGSRYSTAPNTARSHVMSEFSADRWTNSMPRSEPAPRTRTNNIAAFTSGTQPESETQSVSSSSFISAISSQEDMTLVNLHMQTNRPIVDSPLLMSSYIHNLPQFRCVNWSTCCLPSGNDAYTVPLFKRMDDGTLLYVGPKYVPYFEAVGQLNTLKLVMKQESERSSSHGQHLNLTPHFNSQIKSHPYTQAWWDLQHHMQDSKDSDSQVESNATTSGDHKSGLFVRLRGETDIMLTPLVLESLQKFVESLTPVVSNVHPITVINRLRLSCMSTVKKMNILKQDQYIMNWLPHLQAGKRSLANEKDNKCELATIPRSNVYEEIICDQIQATVSVPRVNVIFLQSSVVEDLISFSGHDNIQDLTCVSLFGVSIDNVNAKYVSSKKTLESVQLYYRPTIRSLGSKKTGIRSLVSSHTSGSTRNRGPEKGEPVYIETSQEQSEDTKITLSVGKVHAQLRRLQNEATQVKDTTITGLHCQHSKVFFKCVKIDSCSPNANSTACPSASETQRDKNKIGYIMFECGLEGVTIKVSKHSQAEKSAPEEKQPFKGQTEPSYPESVKSCDDAKPDRTSKPSRASGIEELFRKRESNSKPSTPNLGNTQTANQPQADPNASIPEADASHDSNSAIIPVKESNNASCCIIDLKVVWFNFAAPPRTPISKKIDFTRLDWNLLSTASPAINAWMNPCNRLGIKVVALYRAYYRSVTATAASLMAGALDVSQLHVPIKSRYGRHTPMSKQLREEPSLQLCAVLMRYALQSDPAAVQADLAERHLPSLSTLRQGVIVLSRQWKNILYTPLLLEHNYKSKVMKPLNVTFALPELHEGSMEGPEYQVEPESLDENSMLLDINKLSLPAPLGMSTRSRPNSFASSSPPSVRGGIAANSRTSLVFPMLPFTRKNQFDDIIGGYGTLMEDVPTVGSNPSLYSPHGSDENVRSADRAREDLYSWMAKQDPSCVNDIILRDPPPPEPVSNPTTIPAPPAASLYPLQDSLMLLDAHVIFKPFLSAVGVSPHQVAYGESKHNQSISEGSSASPALEALGSKLSMFASMDMFRIDIVVSEFGKPEKKKVKVTKGKGNPSHIDIPSEMPAFLCEKVGIEVDLRKVADMTVDDLIQRQNVLYISRGQLKKHINTKLNFDISIRFISQQVNMPLLRLLHQISSMYQNVKDTQIELRSQTKISRRQNKNASSSASDFHENLVSASSLERDGHFPLDTLMPLPSQDFHQMNIHAPSTQLPTSLSQQKINTPSQKRPQSFAQKLRSTGKSVKGRLGAYSFLNEAAHTPVYVEDAAASVDRGSSIAGSTINADGVLSAPPNSDTKMTPRCWRIVYYLLDLYAAMPDARTITHRFSVTTDIPEHYKHSKTTPRPNSREQNNSNSSGAGMGIMVVGNARIHRTRLLASLSGLKLEAEITSLEVRLTTAKSNPKWSLAGQLGRTMIVLLEGVAPNQQTVVKVTVGKSQASYSWEGGRVGATGLLSVGAVRVDLPQHPVALHGVMTRSSRQLSSTLQELGVTRTSSRMSRTGTVAEDAAVGGGDEEGTPPPPAHPSQPSTPRSAPREPLHQHPLLQPVILQFTIGLQSLSVTAALLPSLQAQYRMNGVHSAGVTGNKAHFTIDLPHHSLSFSTKIQVTEANIPQAASVALPAVHVSAQYVAEGSSGGGVRAADTPIEGVVLRAGSYLSATADIGLFEHTLSTDLLNHLVFVQKVFMKEVNEVVQKVYGGEKPVPLWNEEELTSSALSRVLFSLMIRIKRIQLTATTPSNSAVRLETGAVEFSISNRVQNVSQPSTPYSMKIFAKAQVDVNLSLGQLIKNSIFEEAESEFQQYAFFNTRIAMRNAFQDEMVSGEDKEVVLITLKRPLIYIQPMAIDKAILVWLNYKNAYEYWNEKRLSLNKEVLTATQQVFEKVQLTSQLSSQHLSTLFLQLTVDDMGICIPLNQPTLATWGPRNFYDLESRGAVVVTLESTSISACSSGSLVSKGRFVGLCLRFADDFETSLDDWKPNMNDPSIMNFCVVSEGTYEVCSRTVTDKHNENAKWFLNVLWQMEGVDIHLDVNIGKHLSALGHTLTMLTGFEEEEPLKMDDESDLDDEADVSKDSQDSIVLRSRTKYTDSLPAFVFDPTLDPKKRSKLIEKEMHEQVKIINDLKSLGASDSTVEHERKRMHELEALLFKDFRRDIVQKIRRQSVKAASVTKGKLGLGSNRSRSFIVPSPERETKLDLDNDEVGMNLTTAAEASDSGETLLLPDEEGANLTDIIEGGSWSSVESSPLTGPSRSASLRASTGARTVTFQPTMQRQSSLPTGSEDVWGSHIDVTEPVQFRRKMPQSIPSLDGSANATASGQSKKTAEPNIDFELDVKVLINSGKCVFHTKDPTRDEDIKIQQRMRKERSASQGLVDLPLSGTSSNPPPSPSASRKHSGKTPSGTHYTHHYHHRHANLVDLTIFHIPGLDVKVHYESKTLADDNTSPSFPNLNTTRKISNKKAALFAWITLQSIPEETIISPHILEFLEQTLEPIPTKAPAPPAETAERSWSAEGGTYGQYVYASFPVDVIVYFHMQPSTFRFSCLPVSRVECMLQLPSLRIVFSSKRAQEEEMTHPAVAMGGLSVTGCLADFSVYIFHPYGGKKSSIKEAQWSPLSDSERKDSLSINVEFVKFHLSRSRKLDFTSDQDKSRAIVRFSTIVDIGSASFKYDMRRLTEILAFPKAWYRRSIVRHMFLGDVSVSAPAEPDLRGSPLQVSPILPQRERTKNVEFAIAKEQATNAAWETLVLFAVNFTKLNVHMNMGNVMGNVSWQSRDFHCMGRLSIGSTGHRNMYVGVGLGGSTLDAKGGIVGGTISLATIHTYVHIMEEPGCNPGHRCGVGLNALELRLDYMGTSVLMARVSCLACALRDEWMSHSLQTHPKHAPTARPAIILVHGTLRWQQLQLMMSRSTTPDLLKMRLKLEEFFTQQFKSSKRVFSSLHPNYNAGSNGKQKKKGEQISAEPPTLGVQEPRHHRHWQKVLSLVSGMRLSTLPTPMPANGTVLGGTMELQGTNISLACFHGNSFKSKSWALFSLKDPSISFATEAQQITEQGVKDVHVVQSLTASLGGAGGADVGAHHQSMATVCRMSRSVVFPPQFKTLREWFHYAFSKSEIDAIECFPSLERESGSMERSNDKDGKGDQVKSDKDGKEHKTRPKLADPHHTREVIFALPSLQLHLRTRHLQHQNTPTDTDEKPMVECSFITEFDDHIFVSVDAEAFLFLHDLIASYLKEKERVMPTGVNSGRSAWGEESKPSGSTAADSSKTEPVKTDPLSPDWRDYKCITWHLEPTVRLLSWGGKSIEPYGVDYILQKLGFSHARTTIPKWLQRGTLDPLDKLLAVVLQQLVAIVPHERRDKRE